MLWISTMKDPPSQGLWGKGFWVIDGLDYFCLRVLLSKKSVETHRF